MHTAYLDLNADAESAHEPFGAAWVDAMRMAVEIDGGDVDELALLTTKWRDPATPTKAAAADAVMKLVTAGVLPPDSAVTLEQLGFDQTTIDRIVADRRRSRVATNLSVLASQAPTTEATDVQAATDAV